MHKLQAAITGTHGYVPEYILTNAELETMVDTSDEWITTRTGIKERRILKNGKPTSYMAIEAVNGLLKKTKTDPATIDLIICATITPDMPTPPTANIISKAVGATKAFGFDLEAACSGFLYGIVTAEKFILSGQCKKVIVIGADKMSSITDFEDRNTCILFGDGAGAVLMEPNNEGFGIIDSVLKSDGSGQDLLYIKSGGSKSQASYESIDKKEYCIKQDGKAVYKHAVNEMVNITKEIIKKNNIDPSEIKYIVPHQANKRIVDAVTTRLGLPLEKSMITLDKYGNTTGATLPLCLWQYENKLSKGDKIIFVAFGAGFTWGATYAIWAYD